MNRSRVLAHLTHRPHQTRRAHGITLVEAVLSVLLVGGVLISALNTLGGSQKAQRHLQLQRTGDRLSQSLLDEIRGSHTNAPTTLDGSSPPVGTDGPSRSGFDHPLDYQGWQQSPPVDRFGVGVPDAQGFTRAVSVQLLDPTNLIRTVTTDQGLYEVKISVTYDNRVIRSSTAIVGDNTLDSASNPEGYR